MTKVERSLRQAEVYLRDVNKVPLRANDAVLVQGALDAVLEALTALESERMLASGYIGGIRYTEGACWIVVVTRDAQNPQFNQPVIILEGKS